MSTLTRKTKVQGARKPTAEEYRVLAEYAEAKEADQRKQSRKDAARRAFGVPVNRWATEQHVKVAGKQQADHQKEQAPARPTGDQWWEQQRAMMIRSRNRARRLPWYASLGSTGVGLAGQGITTLFASAGVEPMVTAGAVAAVPTVVAAVTAASRERRYHRALARVGNFATAQEVVEPAHRRWAPELAAAGIGGTALVFWIALVGMSWLALLVVLVGTVAGGWRWWKANPIGPGVPALEPPRRAVPVSPTPTFVPDVDPIADAWKRKLPKFGTLTDRKATDHTVHYTVELPSDGETTTQTVLTSVLAIAGPLGLDPQQVIPEPPLTNEHGWRPANRARITFILRDVAAGMRYWTGPNLQTAEDGTAAVLTNLARLRDGRGEAKCTMWNRDGMVPTTIYGGTGSGKSAAVNAITIGAMSTGLLNSIYVDFKGNSSGMLRSRARIAVVGRDAITDVRKLTKLLTDVRIKNDPRDKQFPTQERPGWYVFIEEIAKGIKGDTKFAQEMENMATTVRSLGIWLVCTAHDMHSSAWANTNTRAAFSKQAFVFYMNTQSDSLINGLTYRASTLPTYPQDEAALGQDEQPIPGFGVGVNTYRSNVPARWDWLPSDDDPVDEEPPYRASSAWDAFARQPDLAKDEYAALVEALGPPNADGRWIIGIGGTHHFAEDTTGDTDGGGSRPVRTGGFSARSDEPPQDPQSRVWQLIDGGTNKRADIVDACRATMSTSTIDRALDALVGASRIKRSESAQGVYVVVKPDVDTDSE